MSPGLSTASATTAGPAASSNLTAKSGPPNVDGEDEDDGQFDIDDLSSKPPAFTVEQQESKDGPVMYSPSGESLTFPERHQAAPVTGPSSQLGLHRSNSSKSPSEHDLSHSSAQHLRQYATYPRDGSSGGHSSRDRNLKGTEANRSSTSQTSAAQTTRPRSRNSIKRSHRVYNRHNTDRVKAFVVFGADSSDLDSGTSADESDDTAFRQAQQP